MAAKRAKRQTRADRVIAFLECLIVPHGEGAQAPMKLDPFQKSWIRQVYRERAGRRIVRSAILSIARKNGKSALMAGLALVHLVGPEAIPNGEIVSAANDREQAAVVFKLAAQMVRADPELLSMINIIDSTKRMVCYLTGTVYMAISAEAGTKHGMNPSVFIFDELAQAKNRELYDVLDTAQGARSEPLAIIISTQSNDPQHILSQLIDRGLSGEDETIHCDLYSVPDDEPDIFDPKCWKKANPALGTFRSLTDFQAKARQAKALPSFENTFRNLYLNQRVSHLTTLLPRNIWNACADPELTFARGEEVVLSLDLAGTTDLAALGMMSVEGARFLPWFWKAEDLLEEHGRRDRMDYPLFARQGLLETSPGRSIDPMSIALKIGELASIYKVVALVYDRWRMEQLKRELDRADITFQEGPGGGIPLYPWGQGFVSMSPALEALETIAMEGVLRHPGHPLLTWNVANAVVSTDPAGNRKFDKEKSRLRIDGAQVLAMAAGKRAQMIERADGPSFWELA